MVLVRARASHTGVNPELLQDTRTTRRYQQLRTACRLFQSWSSGTRRSLSAHPTACSMSLCIRRLCAVWPLLLHTCSRTDGMGLVAVKSRRSHHHYLCAKHTWHVAQHQVAPPKRRAVTVLRCASCPWETDASQSTTYRSPVLPRSAWWSAVLGKVPGAVSPPAPPQL